MNTEKTAEWHGKGTMASWLERARQCLAGGVSSQFRISDPTVFSHGAGTRVWDIDGTEYLDFTLSQGPLIHGHSHPDILAAVAAAQSKGQIWSALHCDEIRLAEKLVEFIPCADRVRFGCTGSEADHTALRLARAATGRRKIIKFEGHYHGWLDNVAGSINPPLSAAGPITQPVPVPWTNGLTTGSLDDLVIVSWNDAAAVERAIADHPQQIAAIITEPCMCNSGCVEPVDGFLQSLRQLATQHGIVLIFDEVITGFRLALGGAQQYYGVTPDLAIFGKAVAGGFPISVLAGTEGLMQKLASGEVIQAGTLNAHTGAIAACLASLKIFQADGGRAFSDLQSQGQYLMAGLRRVAKEAGQHVLITGPGPMFHMGFVPQAPGGSTPTRSARPLHYRDVAETYDTARYAEFVRRMNHSGVRLIGRGLWYLSTVHQRADLDHAISTTQEVLTEMANRSA